MTKMKMLLMMNTPLVVLAMMVCAESKSITINSPLFMMEQMKAPEMVLAWAMISKVFLGMVLFITTIVVAYSETYMEHYNNKKFMWMLSGFLGAMVALVTSEAIINLMTGWEMLGLTSLALIMFYPNKTGKVNSILTMFFNRLGDVCLIIVFASMMMSGAINTSMTQMSSKMWILILVCALTKSAQFPMSAWLPAAMAAPTPISAMVHSSTLVTAGIFMMMKFKSLMSSSEAMTVMAGISMLSFMMGGVMACIENDFKKMIAFSTMSQISMIMHFTATTVLSLAMLHMVYHALFKTLLFCMAGLMFMKVWGAQSAKKVHAGSENSYLKSMTVISIFSMTGLLFSASFFTKDLYLEVKMMSENSLLSVMFLMAASVMTMVYSLKMMSPFKKSSMEKTLMDKSSESKEMVTIATLTALSGVLALIIYPKEEFPMLNMLEVSAMILILMLIPMIATKHALPKKVLMSLTNDVGHMKGAMYSNFYKLSKKTEIMVENDLLTLKKSFMLAASKPNIKTYMMNLFMATIAMASMMYYSNSLGNVALKMLKNKNKSSYA